MNLRTLLFVAIVVGYFALEIVVASRNAYRMEPEFIFGEFVDASHAVSLCGTLKPTDADRFNANYSYARRRAVDAVAEDPTAELPGTVEAFIQTEESGRRRAVDELVEKLGCADIEVFKLRKRYENLARMNLPTRESDWSG